MFTKKALAASVSAPPAAYVEDVFSTFLYTGNGSTQTITNGIDLAGEGGLVWIKGRSGATGHRFTDTARGATKSLESNSTAAEATESTGLTAFNANGFSLGADADYSTNAATYASWTFRKAEKFFDVVTYTGNGASNRNITHSLGSTPGCVIVKATSSSGAWAVWHRGDGTNAVTYFQLNSTAAGVSSSSWSSFATSSVIKVGSVEIAPQVGDVNVNGVTYVAYLFAHDAGGFGDGGADNVISCGSYTGNGSASGPTVTLGWEPQWVLIKASSAAGSWFMLDTMRGIATGGDDAYLSANTTNAEALIDALSVTPTGFQLTTTSGSFNTNTATYIYIAIRRGPMKTPTDATKVFGLNARTGTGANATVTGGQLADAVFVKNRGSAVGSLFASRLTGTGYLETSSTAAEVAAGTTILQANPWDVMDGVKVGTTSTITNASSNTFINHLFRRAPGFFDVVAYTGNGATDGSYTVSHSLQAVPELILVKNRSNSSEWVCYHKNLTGVDSQINLNSDRAAATGGSSWNPQLTTFAPHYAGNASYSANNSSQNYIAYLFATLSGVSKVGSYTGTAATLDIDCGFTAGCRFLLIKRTDSTGDWFVWDTARGIIAANDPYLLLNSTAAEVTNTDYIDPLSSGFQISSTAPAAINASGGSFIFLAIA